MKEEQAITKDVIDKFLQDNISQFIDNIFKQLESKQLESKQPYMSEDDFAFFNGILTDIREYENDSENIISSLQIGLSNIYNDFEELKPYLDIKNDFQIETTEIIEQIVYLLVSRELIKIEFLLSNFYIDKDYTVFLSHCSWDSSEVLGLKLLLEDKYNVFVYVDWIDEIHLNFPRSIIKIIDAIMKVGESIPGFNLNEVEKVLSKRLESHGIKGGNSDKKLSEIIVKRLKSSKSVIYVQSRHYDVSRWMPWELGIAEASDKKIFRLPIKYKRSRKKYGKRSGFLIRYESILNNGEKFKNKQLK